MTHSEFCYWLNGYFELSKFETLDSRQIQIIKDHLALVFKKVTPSRQDYCAETDSKAKIIEGNPLPMVQRGTFLTKKFTGEVNAGC